MKIVFVGTVEFSKKTLQKLIELKADIAGVITREKSPFNSEFADLTDLCKQNKIPYKYMTNINLPQNINWVKSLSPDIIFCFGFSQIIKSELLSIAPMGIVGFHPAKLPQNRGRHPIIWSLALGLNKTASTFFFIDDGVDSGDILSQVDIDITYEDNARTLYDKITRTALIQIEEFLPSLVNKTYTRTPQCNIETNYWRKRTKKDGEIDFRMNSRAIYNLVRAITKPYAGAHVVCENKDIKVWKAKEQTEINLPNIECGKVLCTNNNHILVKCFDTAVLLEEHEFSSLPKVGDYLT